MAQVHAVDVFRRNRVSTLGVQLLLIFARIGAVDDKLACRDTQAGQDVWTKEYEVRYD